MTSKAAAAAELARAGLEPRGLSREQAAAYIGVGAVKFDAMVDDGRMPRPKRIDGRRVWDRRQLDTAFAALPDEGGAPRDDETGQWSASA